MLLSCPRCPALHAVPRGAVHLGLIAYSVAMLQVLPGSADAAEADRRDHRQGHDVHRAHHDLGGDGRARAQHPLLGIGYGAYWTLPVPGKPAYDYIRAPALLPGSAHNGYLDILQRPGRGRRAGAVRLPDHVRGAGAEAVCGATARWRSLLLALFCSSASRTCRKAAGSACSASTS
jgi:hypothetical protein